MNRVLPILFNTEMVQAILDNRKTQARRLVNIHSDEEAHEGYNDNEIHSIFGNEGQTSVYKSLRGYLGQHSK